MDKSKELVLNMLAETSSTEISKSTNPNGFEETKQTVVKGANIAKLAKDSCGQGGPVRE